MVSVDVKHHVYLFTEDEKEGVGDGCRGVVVVKGWVGGRKQGPWIPNSKRMLLLFFSSHQFLPLLPPPNPTHPRPALKVGRREREALH